MSIKQRRLKIVIGEGYGNAHLLDSETGQDLTQALHVTGLTIYMNKRTRMQPEVVLELVDVDIEVEANVIEETTVAYRRLE